MLAQRVDEKGSAKIFMLAPASSESHTLAHGKRMLNELFLLPELKNNRAEISGALLQFSHAGMHIASNRIVVSILAEVFLLKNTLTVRYSSLASKRAFFEFLFRILLSLHVGWFSGVGKGVER